MSSPAKRPATTRKRQRDPFRYGVRLVRGVLPDGTRGYVPTPMPKEALLHPGDEDYPLVTHAHDDDCNYLKDVIGSRLPRGWVVLANCRVDWGVPGVKPHGPDISVFRGLRGRKRDWKTFYVAEEKARPVAAIEVVSPGTGKIDLKINVREYYRAGVPCYAIVNARTKDDVRTIEILGYRRGAKRYEKMELDEQGRLLLEPLGILLGVEDERVCCYDAQTGEKIGDYAAVVQARLEAEKQARAARKQAQAADKEAEAARSDAEAARRAQAQAEVRARQLEEELRRLRGEA